MISRFAQFILRVRYLLIIVFTLITVLCGVSLTNINTNPTFEKTLPVDHPYIKTFVEYRETFGNANRVIVSYKPANGTIYSAQSLNVLKEITEDLFYLEGIERSSLTSIFTPNVRYMEVVEEGFKGGNIISADFSGTKEEIEKIKSNIIKSVWNGRIVTRDGTQAIIFASLQNKDLDVKKISNDLEVIRTKYERNEDKIFILGFSKAIGDIIGATKSVLSYFGLAFLLIMFFTYFYTRSWIITAYVVFSGLIPVIWLLGVMPIFNLGFDPLSILVPFLIFAIAVSHAVQMTNVWKLEMVIKKNSVGSAVASFEKLFLPGSVALLANSIGFMVIALVDITVVREMAFVATIGVTLMIISNKILLPVLLGCCPSNIKFKESINRSKTLETVWKKFSIVITPSSSKLVLVFSILLFGIGLFVMKDLQIGELKSGVSELKDNSRYNLDTAEIVNSYDFNVDNFRVVAEITGDDSPCLDPEIMKSLGRFEFFIYQNPNVIALEGMAGLVKKINQAYSENYIKWYTIPSTPVEVAQGVGYATKRGNAYMNTSCSVLPISIFLKDRKATTIKSIINDINFFNENLVNERINIRMALGMVGVSASRNEVIEASEPIVNGALFFSVGLLCLFLFRSITISFAILVPLVLVTIWCNALMVFLGIGVKMNTLPVIALGVAVGVDYGIYLFERMRYLMRSEGLSLELSYIESLRQRGSASIFTACVTSVAVFSWYFSDLKFQQDMGILLGFMFIFNLLGAIILAPVLIKIFEAYGKKTSEYQ